MGNEWIIRTICDNTELKPSEVRDMLEKRKEWNEEDVLLEIAQELGVDLTRIDPLTGLVKFDDSIKELSILDVLESLDYQDFTNDLREIHALFKDDTYECEEKYKLYRGIVDKTRISKYLTELLALIKHIPENYQYREVDYQFEAFDYLYDRILRKGLMIEKFPEFLKIFEPLDYNLIQNYWTFSRMINKIKRTDVMKRYFSLIEATLINLLNDFDTLPDNLGKYLTKQDIYNTLVDTIEGTELLQEKVPHLFQLFEVIPDDYGFISNNKYGILLDLIGLMEGRSLLESQYSSLLFTLNSFLDAFDEIDKDEILFNTFSMFLEALMQEIPTRTKEIIMKKISLYATNLSSLKKRLPKIWDEYKK